MAAEGSAESAGHASRPAIEVDEVAPSPAGPLLGVVTVQRAPQAGGTPGRKDIRIQAVLDAKARGYEGDSCDECGAMTMVRNGSCLKCVSCGSTSGCS